MKKFKEVSKPSNSQKTPTTMQIARLTSHLRESEQFRDRLNFPVTAGMLFAITSLPLRYVFDVHDEKGIRKFADNVMHFMAFITKKLDLPKSSEFTVTLIVGFMFLLLWARIQYLFYRSLSRVSAMVLPNGLGFSRQLHPAFELQHRLATPDEMTAMDEDLSSLIFRQNRLAKVFLAASLGSTLILPLFDAVYKKGNYLIIDVGTITLRATQYGVAFTLIQRRDFALLKWIERTALDFQSLAISSSIYRTWTNYNTPKQCTNFAQQLKFLSLVQKDWEIIGKDRLASIYFLQLPVSEVKFIGTDFQSHVVSSKEYLRELHRVLLEEKLPVYAVDHLSIVVGYLPLLQSQCDRLKRELSSRLIKIEKNDQHISATLRVLNQLIKILDLKDQWQYYSVINSQHEEQVIYYLSCPAKHAEQFCEIFKGIFENADVVLDKNILSIQRGIILEREIATAEQELKALIPKPAQVYSEKEEEKEIRVKQPRIARELKEQVIAPSIQPDVPESFSFRSGYTFFRDTGLRAGRQAAHPISVPWLREGQAYGAVDGDVFDRVSQYLTEDKVLSRLKVGTVISIEDSKKTKAGATGIQPCTDAYTDVHGVTHTASFKLKFKNNIRIFGHKAEDVIDDQGEKRTLYIFDGPGFGH